MITWAIDFFYIYFWVHFGTLVLPARLLMKWTCFFNLNSCFTGSWSSCFFVFLPFKNWGVAIRLLAVCLWNNNLPALNQYSCLLLFLCCALWFLSCMLSVCGVFWCFISSHCWLKQQKGQESEYTLPEKLIYEAFFKHIQIKEFCLHKVLSWILISLH